MTFLMWIIFKNFKRNALLETFKAGTDEFTKCIISLVDEATKQALEEEDITDERMVIVDVVIIGSTEDVRKRSGINILDGLLFNLVILVMVKMLLVELIPLAQILLIQVLTILKQILL